MFECIVYYTTFSIFFPYSLTVFECILYYTTFCTTVLYSLAVFECNLYYTTFWKNFKYSLAIVECVFYCTTFCKFFPIFVCCIWMYPLLHHILDIFPICDRPPRNESLVTKLWFFFFFFFNSILYALFNGENCFWTCLLVFQLHVLK